eukprot:m.240922 g.240922  ORF g.240922 m.240922 type:complete len:102 (-) comp16530_c0_seq1:130-435(-)
MGDRVQQIAKLSKQIFGHVLNPPNVRSPTKHLRKAMRAEQMMKYYPETVVNQDKVLTRMIAAGIYLDPTMVYYHEKRNDQRRRGKTPTKKGEGKRAQKKKK